MIKTAHAVIGTNYGDEGKGQTVDYITSDLISQGIAPEKILVVRYNGGPQAGHTVTKGDARHVFHTYGSGTLNGCPTMLLGTVAVDPLMVIREYNELRALMLKVPKLFIDPEANAITPFDIKNNQDIEKKRSENCHGSCGMGFNECVTRSQTDFGLQMQDLIAGRFEIMDKLSKIVYGYHPSRRRELGLCPDDYSPVEALEVSDEYCSIASKLFGDEVVLSTLVDVIVAEEIEHLVFEGAQGLMLDMDSRDFPHVTHSKTGLAGIEAGLSPEMASCLPYIDVFYVSRVFASRHGAGPLKYEYDQSYSSKLIEADATNTYNDFQHSLRCAPLDLPRMTEEITNDINAVELLVNVYASITWINYLKEVDHSGNLLGDIMKAMGTRHGVGFSTPDSSSKTTLLSG